MRLTAVLLLGALLLACGSSTTDSAPAPSRASCGPTPVPLTRDGCFYALGDAGEHLPFVGEVQTTNPRGPNYVPPGCPCAGVIEIPTPDGGWTDEILVGDRDE